MTIMNKLPSDLVPSPEICAAAIAFEELWRPAVWSMSPTEPPAARCDEAMILAGENAWKALMLAPASNAADLTVKSEAIRMFQEGRKNLHLEEVEIDCGEIGAPVTLGEHLQHALEECAGLRV